MLKIEKFVVNPLQENSYVVSDETNQCIIIDPGFYFQEEKEEFKNYIKVNGLTPVMIANTHCHIDHILGVEFVRAEYKVPFLMHPEEAFLLANAAGQGEMFGIATSPVQAADACFQENEKLEFGNTAFDIIHIPGHSAGHVVFYSAQDKIIIGGDVLFYGSIGRTDLPGGDHDALIGNIKNKLFKLPGETKVFCGHGPETTLGFEMESNPFLT